jgi:hypothetical protein
MLRDVSGLGDVKLSFAPELKDELLRSSDRRAFSRKCFDMVIYSKLKILLSGKVLHFSFKIKDDSFVV